MTLEQYTPKQVQYIKHNRTVTDFDIERYGEQLATHDMLIEGLILYELGKIPESKGIDINKQFVIDTMEATNNWIKKRHLLPFAKNLTQWNKPVEEVNSIPIIMNHKTDEVENEVGKIKGLLYVKEVKGIASLFAEELITDLEAKKAIQDGRLRSQSMGTRGDKSIKEVSFVINEAAPLCGLMLSENDANKPQPALTLTEQELQLTEELRGLRLAEREIEDVIIPNHIILSRMIKSGKIYPFAYEKLIRTNNKETLQLMEYSLPSKDLGLMLGTEKQPQKMPVDNLQKTIADAKKKHGIQNEIKLTEDIIVQDKPINNEQDRIKELKHILELSELNPALATQYVKCELGEVVDEQKYKDIQLSEYTESLKSIKQKISNVTLTLGER